MSQANERWNELDLVEVAARLRSERPEAGAVELDQIKSRVTARARAAHGKGTGMRSRLAIAVLTIGIMAAGTGGVIAAGGGGSSPQGSSAAIAQYGANCPKEGASSEYCKGNNLTTCVKYCEGNNNTVCAESCKGNNNKSCEYHCEGDNNEKCKEYCSGKNNPECKAHCKEYVVFDSREGFLPASRRARRGAEFGLAYPQPRLRLSTS